MTERSHALTSPVGPFRTFWIYLSGQSLDLAAENDEVNLYARYGALTFASATLATAIGFCFVFFAITPPGPHGSELPRLLAATLAGLLVGRAILAMDQFIVVYVPTRNGVWHKLANFFARGLATTALVFVGSWTLTPLLASGLVAYLPAAPPPGPDQGRAARGQCRAEAAGTVRAADHRRGSGGTDESSDRAIGRRTGSRSVAHRRLRQGLSRRYGRAAAGPEAARRRPSAARTPWRALASAKQAEVRDLAAQQAKPIDADVFSRHAALSAIEHKDSSVLWLDWLVTFLIAAIDLGPVLMKSFSERSATDEAVLATRQRKHDLREIERSFYREGCLVGARQAAPQTPPSTRGWRSMRRPEPTRNCGSGVPASGSAHVPDLVGPPTVTRSIRRAPFGAPGSRPAPGSA